MECMSWSILGHAWAADMLQQHIANGHMRHAYLLCGPDGVGRRTLALRFAQAVNCPQPPAPGEACTVCRTCLQIEAMQHADLSVVQSETDAESLKVDQVRELQHTLSLTPYESSYRVALLLRFEKATASAQNALLKTLEEPNPSVLLVLTANEPKNLLPTVVSRCEVLRLRPMGLDELANALISRGMQPEQARLMVHIAGGRPGYALRLAADETLLAARAEWLSDFFSMLESSPRDRLAYSEMLSRNRTRAEAKSNLYDGLAHWLSLWRDVLLVTSGSGSALTNPDYMTQIQTLAQSISQQMAARLTIRLEHAFARLPTASLQLMLDNLLLEWPRV